jgi:hypothetical protein
MLRIAIREGAIFLILLALLALAMHPDLFHAPTDRLEKLLQSGNTTHPFVYAFFAYVVLGVFRLLWRFVRRLFKRNPPQD